MAVSKDPQKATAGNPLSAVARVAAVGVVGGAIMAAMAVPVVAGFGKASEVAAEQIGALPAELATPPLPNRTYMLDADGNRIATLFDENRIEVPLDQISENMQRAIVAVEDERFYEHKGVDVQGLIRAQLENTASGSIRQGASTLTMQYVKNVLVTAAADEDQVEAAVEQTTARKLQEIRYAVQLERELTKDEILNRYLNIAYFGSGAYGVEAASRRYFGHSAKKLTPAEAATLAGIAFGNAGVHLPHGMAYAVAGGAHGVRIAGYPEQSPLLPHGVSVILSAPAAFRFTAAACPERHLEAAALLGAEVRGAGLADAAQDDVCGLLLGGHARSPSLTGCAASAARAASMHSWSGWLRLFPSAHASASGRTSRSAFRAAARSRNAASR